MGRTPGGTTSGGQTQSGAILHKALLALCVPATLIGLGLLASYAISNAATEAKQRTLALAFALDFSLTAPALVYLLLVRTKRAPLLAILPTIVIGSIIATIAIPREHHGALDALHMLLIPAELALLAFIVLMARRTYGQSAHEGADFVTRFRAAALRAVEVRRAADVLTTEVSILHYSLRFGATALPDGAYSIHREANYRTFLIGLSMAVVVETVGVHFLIGMWSHVAAWIATGLSVYAMVWLIGDFQAMRFRPIRVTERQLLLRIGVRWEADIALTNIARIERTRVIEDKRDKATLVVQLCGMTNVRVDFVEPVEVIGPYGMRKRITRAHLQIDDAQAFCERVLSKMSR